MIELEEAKKEIDKFSVKLDEISQKIKEVESLFKMFPLTIFRFEINGKYEFIWKEKRLLFNNGLLKKPFIECSAVYRWAFHDFLPAFIKAMTEEIKFFTKHA